MRLLRSDIILGCTCLAKECAASWLSLVDTLVNLSLLNLLFELSLHMLSDQEVLVSDWKTRESWIVCANAPACKFNLTWRVRWLLESIGRDHSSGRLFLLFLLFGKWVIRTEDHALSRIGVHVIICAEYVATLVDLWFFCWPAAEFGRDCSRR